MRSQCGSITLLLRDGGSVYVIQRDGAQAAARVEPPSASKEINPRPTAENQASAITTQASNPSPLSAENTALSAEIVIKSSAFDVNLSSKFGYNFRDWLETDRAAAGKWYFAVMASGELISALTFADVSIGVVRSPYEIWLSGFLFAPDDDATPTGDSDDDGMATRRSSHSASTSILPTVPRSIPSLSRSMRPPSHWPPPLRPLADFSLAWKQRQRYNNSRAAA